MDFFDTRYFRLCKIFMTWIGQWPYDTSTMKSLRRIFMCVVFLSIFQVEIAKLVTCKCDLDGNVEIFLSLLVALMSLTKYCTCWINTDGVKNLLDRIEHNWCTLKVDDEIKIMDKYAKYAYISACTYCSIGIFVCLSFGASIISIISPLNESRPQRHPFEGEYFFDREHYFYLICIHIFVSVVVIHTILGATDWISIMFVLHACALFHILGYRLEHLFDDAVNSIDARTNFNGNCKFHKRIGRSVQYHRKALEFVRLFEKCYIRSYAIQLLLAVLILTALLFRLFMKLASRESIWEVFIPVAHVISLLLLIFCNLYPSQILINNSGDIFYQIYYARWYMAPVKTQKSLVLLMRRYMEPCRLTAASLATGSVEFFLTIVHTSISYFTVLYAARN